MKKFSWRLTESECCTWSCFCQVFNPKRSCSQSKMQAIYQNESADSSNALVTATKPKVLINFIHFLLFADCEEPFSINDERGNRACMRVCMHVRAHAHVSTNKSSCIEKCITSEMMYHQIQTVYHFQERQSDMKWTK